MPFPTFNLPTSGQYYDDPSPVTLQEIQRVEESPLKTAAVIEVRTLPLHARLCTEYPAEYSERAYRLVWYDNQWASRGAATLVNVDEGRSFIRVATQPELETLVSQLAEFHEDKMWAREELLIGSWYHIHDPNLVRQQELAARFLTEATEGLEENSDEENSDEPAQNQA